jgi:hypothetical protein
VLAGVGLTWGGTACGAPLTARLLLHSQPRALVPARPPCTHTHTQVVAYAAERCIEVVPEIELPGHCVAALAAYPHLSCEHEGRLTVKRVEALWPVHRAMWSVRVALTSARLDTRAVVLVRCVLHATHTPSGTGEVSAVSTHWGIHEDVYCAVSEAVRMTDSLAWSSFRPTVSCAHIFALAPSLAHTRRATTPPSPSWRLCWTRWWLSSPAPTSTSAGMRCQR